MLSSAVNLVAAAALLSSSQQGQPALQAAWRGVAPSLASLQSGGMPAGVAALIDDSGLFIAHSSGLASNQVIATLSDNTIVTLTVQYVDQHTQLALLRANHWRMGVVKPISVAGRSPSKGAILLAATPSGPHLGEFVSDNRVGVMKPSLRYIPLSEVRLETIDQRVGGSMVFDVGGNLVGILGATLAAKETGGSAASSLDDLANQFNNGSTFGPRGLTVAYAIGPEVVGRVVKGFRSPQHRAEHPTIGIFFKASGTGRGVLVDSVLSQSAAAIAGIKPGDLILEFGGQTVNDPIILASLLFRQEIGKLVTVRVQRGNEISTVDVRIASDQAPLYLSKS